MNIYKADDTHVDIWLPLAEEFYNEGFEEYKWGFNEEHARITFLLFIQNHLCFMAEEDGKLIGCFAGVITQHHFNYDFRYFQEAMWYVKKEFRGTGVASQLLEAVTTECERLEVQKIAVGHPVDRRLPMVEKIYKQMGFRPFENHYIKDL